MKIKGRGLKAGKRRGWRKREIVKMENERGRRRQREGEKN